MRKFLHLLAFAALLVSACSNPMLSSLKKDNGQPSSYTVTFNSQGGTDVASVKVSAGAVVNHPDDPVLSGFVFAGWFATDACIGSAVSFPYTVTQDITLYAKWTAEAVPVTLSFNTGDGSSVNSVTVNSGTSVEAVGIPQRTGYTFAGWYLDSGWTGSAVAFPYTLVMNVTLYAKWAADTVPVTISFDAQGGSAVASVSQNPGTTIDSSPVTTRSGYTFGGWFATSDCAGSPVSFPYTMTQDATLYAKWTEVSLVVSVSNVALNKDALTLTAGTSTTLVATVTPANATNKAVSWTSSDASIATVSNGTVAAIAAGSATITVTTEDGGYSDICSVTVEAAAIPVTGVSLNKDTLALYEGSSETLTATVSPADATDKAVIWTSTNTAAATVDQAGKITAVAAGTATVKATTEDGGFAASCAVTVSAISKPVTAVALDYATLTLKKGKSQTLVASVTPSDASEKNITWTTSDPSVATVSGGTVTAVSAGTATITASSNNGKTATCEVTVPSLASLTVNASASTVFEGGTVTLAATAVYSDKSTAAVTPTYTVSDSSIATVDAGIVTGVCAGSTPATVTASYTEDGVTKTATVDIAVDFDGIKIKVAKSLGYNQIYYWNLNGDTTKKNAWPGTAMSASGDDYVYSFSGASSVLMLITKDSGTKLCSSNMSITAKGVYRVTSTGAAKESYTPPADDMTIYVKAASAPAIWVWEVGGNTVSTSMGYTWPGPTMTAATGLKDNTGWYQFAIPGAKLSGKAINMKLNSGAELVTGKAATFWYDGTAYYDADPTTPPVPVAPTVSVKPASGEVALSGSIILSYTDGNDADNLTVTASVNDVSYTKADFTSGQLVVKVSDITTTAGTTIPVSISAANGAGSSGTTSVTLTTADIAVDKFTWDNALVYFVLTDRFYNGNTANDHSYYRVNNSTNSAVPDVATFHGGDIAGLTAKLDYLDQLGVNAIWITAPYEQIRGWVSGKNDAFPHYAYHGYYTLDWTFMDKNMGTVAEFRTFVTEAHKRGIRVVMDVVMNHTGYNTIEDMITYGFGSTTVTSHGWVDTGGDWGKNHDVTDYTSNLWSNWWSSWVRGFDGKFGCATPGGDDLTMSLAGLPDVVTEKTGSYDIPTFLKTKWAAEDNAAYDAWRIPAAANLRKNLGVAPADYLVKWLAAWVEEFGVDGFRCDTAKHVDRYRWGQLKDACNAALATWRASARADSVAKNWDENFWMTGECFGWSNSISGDYYTTGKFDSMINFAFNGAGGSNGSSSGSTPTVSTWATYANMINNNSDHNNMLSYVSSHDTGLHRPSDMKNVGTMLCLLPGGVQIYYGDETARPYAYQSYGDSDMMTRGDMNWSGYDASVLAHWQKVGSFRENHPAVGAGVQTAIETNTYGRSYSGDAGDDKVVIKLGTGSVKVSGFFADGTKVRNAYDGTEVTVSGGYAPFTSGAGPILVELVE